ncbi:MAG: hypothetical protein M4579_000754 [Chaenotheca gracillima]|nr:MAG: hypothetical protein M4579_000754 [Chaenotheca gracillima]
MAATSMPTVERRWTARQPGKAIWTVCALLAMGVKVPFWLAYYIPKSLRPHPTWTYRQAVCTRILRAALTFASMTQARTPLNLEPGAEKERFAVFAPSTKDVYRGVAAPDEEVRPVDIGGTWYPSPYQTGDEHTIILHFHGGAFTLGDSRLPDSIAAANELVKHAGPAKVFMSAYRLSSNPGGRFPAALQDAVTTYQALLDQGISPQRIVVSGDSAGGNLAAALMRYFSDHQELFPSQPAAAALLWSPWTDLVPVHDDLEPIKDNRHYQTDFIPPSFPVWGSKTYAAGPADVRSPYISPRDHGFPTSIPIWVQVGALEVLYDDGITFAENLKNVPGNDVEVHVEPYANHDILMTAVYTGFNAELTGSIKAARRFIDGQRKGGS